MKQNTDLTRMDHSDNGQMYVGFLKDLDFYS